MTDEVITGQTFAAVLGNVLKGMLVKQKTRANLSVDLPELLPLAAKDLAGLRMKVTFEIEEIED